jgi:hypothetical protein
MTWRTLYDESDEGIDEIDGWICRTHLRWKQRDRSSMAHVGPWHCGSMTGRNAGEARKAQKLQLSNRG